MNNACRFLMFGFLYLTLANQVLAQSVWPQAYDATYEMKTPRGVMPMRMLSNGKGMSRTDISNGKAGVSVSIIDYPNKAMYTMLAGSNIIRKGPPTGNTGQKIDKDEAKRLNATDLGSKVISNHTCQGWSYATVGGGTREVWIDNSLGITVKATTSARGITTEMNLKSVSPDPPPDSVFQLPRGYTVVDATTKGSGVPAAASPATGAAAAKPPVR